MMLVQSGECCAQDTVKRDICHVFYSWILDGTILAILNLQVAPISPMKLWLKLTYGMVGDVV